MGEATRELFDDWAERGRGEGMEEGHFPRAEQALENMPVMPGDRVVDLGCGNGWASRWLRHCVGDDGQVIGIDFAPKMVALATGHAAGVQGISFLQASFDDLPWEDGEIDHAFSMEALYYADDVNLALREVVRVLRPGGTLTFCTDFYAENPYCHGWQEDMGIPMALKSEQQWCDALKEAGFTATETMRCLDPRPVDEGIEPLERADVEDFRRNVGSLAILATR